MFRLLAFASWSNLFPTSSVDFLARRAERLLLEQELADLVNQAYGLTPAEVRLLWETAPPRMPIPAPATATSRRGAA